MKIGDALVTPTAIPHAAPITLPVIAVPIHTGQPVGRWEDGGARNSARSTGSGASENHTARSDQSNRSVNSRSRNSYASRLSNFLSASNDRDSRTARSQYSEDENSGGRSVDTYTHTSYTGSGSYTSNTGTLSQSRTSDNKSQSTTVADSYANTETLPSSNIGVDRSYVIENDGGRIDLQPQTGHNNDVDDRTLTASVSKNSIDEISIISDVVGGDRK